MKDYLHVVVVKGRTYNYFRPSGRLRRNQFPSVRLSDDPAEAQKQARLLADLRMEAGDGEVMDHIAQLLKEARRRAKNKRLPFSLTEGGVMRMVEKQGRRCAVSGLPFDLHDLGGNERAFRRPFRPSLDRIDCSLGYVPTNVRIVCCAVNLAINEWGIETFLKVATAVVARNNSATPLENNPENAPCLSAPLAA